MRWPWVSRTAYDALVNERDWLRAQNEALREHQARIQRYEAGMAEVPKPPRPPVEPMPELLRAHYDSFANPSLRREMIARAWRRHGRGEAWQKIMEDAMGPAPESPEAEA